MDIAERVALLAQKMGVPNPVGRSSDLETEIWQDDAGCHRVLLERGREISRMTERDPEVFCFRVLEEAAREQAKTIANELGKDHRRFWFPRHVELMRRASDEWACSGSATDLTNAGTCAEGLGCALDYTTYAGTCEPIGTLNAQCGSGLAPCGAGLHCGTTSDRCEILRDDGEACTSDVECWSYYCDSTCQRRPGDTAYCL